MRIKSANDAHQSFLWYASECVPNATVSHSQIRIRAPAECALARPFVGGTQFIASVFGRSKLRPSRANSIRHLDLFGLVRFLL